MNVPSQILEEATAQSKRITAAESCTGGLIAAALTDLPGSSVIFEQGFVTYSNTAKSQMLGVDQDLFGKFGAVSEPVVSAMANGALERSGADIAIAVSGIAGPGASDFKPEGRVCFALATQSDVTSETIEFGALGRKNVRASARDHALSLILNALSG